MDNSITLAAPGEYITVLDPYSGTYEMDGNYYAGWFPEMMEHLVDGEYKVENITMDEKGYIITDEYGGSWTIDVRYAVPSCVEDVDINDVDLDIDELFI